MYRIILASLVFVLASQAGAATVTSQGTWGSTLSARDLDGNPATIEAWYDATLDITWLADANASQSTMSWVAANAWASALNVNGVVGWRLPTVAPIGGVVFDTGFSNNATSDSGYADAEGWVDGTGAPVSELGHLFYVTLGNLGFCAANDGAPTSCAQPTGWGLTNAGPFANIASGLYWTGTVATTTTAFVFHMGRGDQDFRNETSAYSAWAVHDGDIGAQVPVPAALWLLSTALLGLGGFSRRA